MRTVKFKSSEVGPIPEEWDTCRIGDVLELSAAGDLQVDCSVHVKNALYAYPIYSNSLENAGLYGYTSNPRYKRDAVTITGRGTLGHAEYRDEDFDAIIRLIVLRPSKRLDGRYTTLQINFQKPFHFEITSIPQLTVPQVANAIIPIPPRPEQERIAEAISDVDALLSAMTTLIEKKRAIKQGAMQQLLTGKKRLVGFTGPWVEKRLGDCGNFIAGNGFPLRCQGGTSGDFPFFKVSDFSNVGNESTLKTANNYISKKILDELKCNVVPSGAIVFAKIGAAIALERKRIVRQDSCIDNNMMAFVVNESNSNEYLVEVLRQIRFAQLSESTALPALNVGVLRNVSVYIPPTLAEQQAIAAVLSDMDAEIAALEAKRAKYESVKQGMMQELLTGKTRLV